jgi:hypothetical protein
MDPVVIALDDDGRNCGFAKRSKGGHGFGKDAGLDFRVVEEIAGDHYGVEPLVDRPGEESG